MHPILFEIPRMEFLNWVIGPIPIRLYGLMIGLGFIIGILLAARQAKKEGVNPDRILDLGVYVLLAAIVGSRALFVLTDLHEFAAKPLEAFALWKGGLVFYGGLLAAVPVGIWYLRKHGCRSGRPRISWPRLSRSARHSAGSAVSPPAAATAQPCERADSASFSTMSIPLRRSGSRSFPPSSWSLAANS